MKKLSKKQSERLKRFCRYYCEDLPGYHVYASHSIDACSEFRLVAAGLGCSIRESRIFVDSTFKWWDSFGEPTHFEETVLIPALLALPDNECLLYSPPKSVQLKLFSDET